jgi:hypothetical protein
MPNYPNPTLLEDSLLKFPNAFRDNGCYTTRSNNDEKFSVSEGTLPTDRISFWKVTCHNKACNPFPILGISTSRPEDTKASYHDDSFFGWRSDSSSWEGGKLVRDGVEWVGFKASQPLVFRYDPISSPKAHILSIQVVETDIEATMFVPPHDEYRISMTINEGAQVTLNTATIVDTKFWEVQQEILTAKSSRK